jgi:hypothetical protein
MSKSLHHNLASSDTTCLILPKQARLDLRQSQQQEKETQPQYYIKDVTNLKYPLYFQEFNDEHGWIFTSDFSLAYRFDSAIEAICCWKRIIDELPEYKEKLNINKKNEG